MSKQNQNAGELNLDPNAEMIYILTPKGETKNHGYIIGDTFYRNVEEKDRMRIFDAWSINPTVLTQIQQKKGIVNMEYKTHDTIYRISVADAWDKGFTREFKGGATHYIARKHWYKTMRTVEKKKSKEKFKSYSK